MSKEAVWVNYGIDGACSYLIMRWLRGDNIEVRYTTAKRFRQDFVEWQIAAGVTTYDKIFVVGLDVSKCIDVIDMCNVVVVDHHDTHVEHKHLYNNAKTAITYTTSTTRLLFRLFREELIKRLTPQQLQLIALVNDHVSGTRALAASSGINALYWSYSGDRLQRFAHDFANGFQSFNAHQKASISLYNKKLAHLINDLEIFQGNIPFRGINNKILSTFATTSYDEITHHLLAEYQGDIAIIVNLEARAVFMKKSLKCAVPLGKLAERLCDGGGSDNHAGGSVTDKFLDFCKTLQRVC